MSHYGFHVAAPCTTLAPTRVFPPLGSDRVPGCPGSQQMAGGSQESHLTIKQTGDIHLLVLPLLLTLQLSHLCSRNSTDSFGSICSIRWWYWCCSQWFLRWLSGLLVKCLHLPLPIPSEERTTVLEKFSLSAQSPDSREWRKKIELDDFHSWHGAGSPHATHLLDFHCRLPLGFPFSATNRVFHCHASAGCLLGLLYLLAFCGINLFQTAFYYFSVFGCFRSTNLIDKKGTCKRPFSVSNFDNSCRLLRHPLCLINLQVLIRLFTIIWPSEAVSSVWQTWLPKMGVGIFHFYHRTVSLDAWLGFTLVLPLDWVVLIGAFSTFATTWVSIAEAPFLQLSFGVGSPVLLPSTVFTVHCAWRTGFLFAQLLCLYLPWCRFAWWIACLSAHKFSATSCMALSWLVFPTCILSIGTCLRAAWVLEFDDSASESPLSLLAICTHSTLSLAARYLFDTCCVLTFATRLDAHCARGFDDSVHKSLLPTVCATFTLDLKCSTLPT